ncbi:MAG: 3-keto-5-aminohexanoate cleavage protein [Motiliproteus sp.]
MQAPSLIIVAPNGARRSKADHPALPISPSEMAEEVTACAAAGAAMVHLHARDSDGKHSLEIDDNAAMLQRVNDQIGDKIVVQLTTEAVGIYQPEQQMTLIKELQPEAASFALRELIPNDNWLDRGAEFFSWVRNKSILTQYILYSADDLARYFDLLDRGILPSGRHHLLFVLGRYSKGQQSMPIEVLPFLQLITQRPDPVATVPWALCAFGQLEQQCLAAACSLGGDARVGFENNLLRSDGSLAQNNAEQVAQLKQTILSMGRTLHTADSLRQLYQRA